MGGRNSRAMAYLRVSTQQQAEDERNGYGRQLERIRGYAEENGIEVAYVYKEAWTGTEKDRPVFNEMMGDILSDGIKTILVESFDRFSRSISVGIDLLGVLSRNEVRLINCSTGMDLTEDFREHPYSKAQRAMEMVFAELEKDLINYRLRKGRERASRRAGHYVAGRQQQYDKRFFSRLLSMREAGLTFARMAEKLNKEGRATAKGLEWTATRVGAVLASTRREESKFHKGNLKLTLRKEAEERMY